MDFNDIGQSISLSEMSTREDYIDHRGWLDGVYHKISFEELISRLGEPLDDDEVAMVAECICEILRRRLKMVNDAEKIFKRYESKK